MTIKEFQLVFDYLPGMYLLLAPDTPVYTIMAANKAYIETTRTSNIKIIGKPVFSIFPDTSGPYNQEGKKKLAESFMEVILTKKSHAINRLRYDIPANDGSGTFLERYWKVSNTPALDESGSVIQIINSVDDVTELVLEEIKNQKHLEQANLLIQNVLESISDGFVALDRNWNFTYINERGAALLKGMKPEELVGKHIWTLFPEGIGHSFYTNYHKVMSDREPIVIQEYFPPWDKWFENRIYPSPDGGITIFYTDITGNKKAEEQLEASKKHMRMILDTTEEVFLVLDREYRLVTFNKAADELAQLFIGSHLKNGISLLELRHHSARPEMLNYFEQVFAGKKASFDYSISDAKGVERHFVITCIPISNEEGKPDKLMMTARDATKEILSVKALAESEERYKKLFYTNPMPMWIYDEATYRFTEVNDAAIFKYGYSREEFFSMTIMDIRPIDDIAKVKNAYRQQQGDYLIHRDTWCHYKKNGELMYVEITAHHITHNDEPSVLVLINDVTEKKTEEEKLHLMNMVITNTNDAILITEAQPIEGTGPKILFVNEAFTRMTGYTESEVLGKTPRILQGSGTDQHELARLKKALKNWEPCEVEVLNYKKSGEPFWNNFTVAPVANEAGWYTHWVAVERDVTERRKTDALIRDSEEKRRLIMNAALDAIICIDTEGIITFWNPQAEHIFGWKQEEVMGKRLSNIIIPEPYRSMHDHGMEQYKITGKGPALNVLLELNAISRDGVNFPVELTVLPIKQDNDAFFCAFIRDITARKKAETATRRSNERYELVAKATSDAIWDWDMRTGVTTRSGDGLQKLFGYDTAAASADNDFWRKHVHPDDINAVIERREIVLQTTAGQYWEDEYRFERKDGSYAHVYDRGYIIRNKEGKAIRMIGSTQDISALKSSEKQLQELNAVLEKRASELAKSNAELERFAYVASHDLQEPLRMVSSFLQLLDRQYTAKLDDRAREYINFAVGGAERMKRLILDLLFYSRVAMVTEQFQPVDMNVLVQQVIQIFESRFEKEGITLTTDSLPVVQGNATQLQQLLQNLVGNAIKYKSERPSHIEIGCLKEESRFVFFVKDNGIGINPKYFEKIFIVFQRLHSVNNHSGTGIGLAICKKIIEQHHGEIWVESEEGKGSCFFFSMPK